MKRSTRRISNFYRFQIESRLSLLAAVLGLLSGCQDEGLASPIHGGTAGVGAVGGGGFGGTVNDASAYDGAVNDASIAGAGGEPSVERDAIEELVRAICDWEFKCCDRGELDYRLGAFTVDADSCAERFLFGLYRSNVTVNPYPSGSAAGLLGSLAYLVDLNRVELNEPAIAKCAAEWQVRACATGSETPARCATPKNIESDACALTKLFAPKLTLGQACTLALSEGAFENDVECQPGSTCLPADHPENAADTPTCVQRSLEGEPCIKDEDCDYDLFCTERGACQPKRGVGQDCAFSKADAPAPGEEQVPCKPGLSCHPLRLICVERCSEGFTCETDAECPSGMSCAPLTVGDDATSFHVCRKLGDAVSARCDDSEDCVSARFCEAEICTKDRALGEACASDAECPKGAYCDPKDGCSAPTPRGNPCTSAAECDREAAGCVYDADDDRFECSAKKRELGMKCLKDEDCASGLCERGTPAAINMTCIAGALPGEDCDDNTFGGERFRCGPGSICIENICKAQVGPGEPCADPNTGEPQAMRCKSQQCQAQWDEFMCTDAPVPLLLGGTGVVCDGR